jgi:hypothetical protein
MIVSVVGVLVSWQYHAATSPTYHGGVILVLLLWNRFTALIGSATKTRRSTTRERVWLVLSEMQWQKMVGDTDLPWNHTVMVDSGAMCTFFISFCQHFYDWFAKWRSFWFLCSSMFSLW